MPPSDALGDAPERRPRQCARDSGARKGSLIALAPARTDRRRSPFTKCGGNYKGSILPSARVPCPPSLGRSCRSRTWSLAIVAVQCQR